MVDPVEGFCNVKKAGMDAIIVVQVASPLVQDCQKLPSGGPAR